jgi:signal transduction histidine kinase
LFFREAYDVQCAVEEAAAALTAILDLDEVLARLESTITGTMHPEAMATLLFVPEAEAYVVARAYGDLMFPNLGRHTALVAEVQANRHVLSRALLATAKRHTVSGNLQAAQAELLVPLFFQDRLIGVLLLDQKKSHTPYNETDLTLLGTLAGQAALAIENAQKHRVIQQLNESLEGRIQQRTQDLEAALATLRQTQVQLLHNEKMAAIGILAGGMAHEINNPTTIVHGHLELLADYLADLALVWETYDLAELSPESAAAIAAVKARCGYAELQARVPEMIKAALSGTRRIREIVADLRTFSADINRDVVPADKLVEGLTATVNLVQSLFKGYRPIETHIATLPAVTVNAGQINQVISNLLINAKQASGPEGHVSLHAGIVDGEMVVTVCDDGIGIPVEIQPQIFDPFFTTKGIGEGMGLGLSISYALVKAHGGRIEVDSVPGAGATFRVCLPISLPTSTPSASRTKHGAA